ncbi:amidohydrolase [Acidisphaera sp. L21]|uniref:amidohydrolase n=1 Tax=Acidisphaera sp. L21 TaxID=1641851 RepID=UPI0020B129BE|nr:amidohydrolase [Acidisphaera sp. L21]
MTFAPDDSADIDPALAASLTQWRRHLHANPEMSLHETATAAFVAARLTELAVPFETGVGGHGIVATLRRGQSDRSVGLRADMDALPIEEATDVAYASTRPGVMHACGHDGHTTSLLGAAALLVAEIDWAGTVYLVFQPAEEAGSGARAMLADGLFERFPMERIFGYHNWPGLAAGEVAVHDGAVMAQGARVTITMNGHAGHGAIPHLARDPVLAAAHTLVALQSVVSRNIDPLDSAVLSICTLQGAKAVNLIPHKATMAGTFRTHRATVHAQVAEAIERVAHGVAATFGMTADVAIRGGSPAVTNSADGVALAAQATTEAGLTLHRDIPPSMASEDFGALLARRPGAFVWIGNGPIDGGRELHNPHYDFNDAILPAAARYLAGVAKAALAA